MAQATNASIGANLSGLNYRTQDNDRYAAGLSLHSGTSRPSYAVAGTVWLDSTSAPNIHKLYDGTSDAILGVLDSTNHIYKPSGSALAVWGGTSTGAANVFAVTCSPIPTAYYAGMVITWLTHQAPTGACTINANAIGSKNLTKNGATALVGTEWASGAVVTGVYDGTQVQVIGVSGGGGTTALATQTINFGTGQTYTTLQAAMAYLLTQTIAVGATITLQGVAGTTVDTTANVWNHPQGSQVDIVGAAPVTLTYSSWGTQSGTTGAYVCTMNVVSTTGVAVNDLVLISAIYLNAKDTWVAGCWLITALTGTSITFTVTCPKPSMVVPTSNPSSQMVLKTIIGMGTTGGIKVTGFNTTLRLRDIGLTGSISAGAVAGLWLPSDSTSGNNNLIMSRSGMTTFNKTNLLVGDSGTNNPGQMQHNLSMGGGAQFPVCISNGGGNSALVALYASHVECNNFVISGPAGATSYLMWYGCHVDGQELCVCGSVGIAFIGGQINAPSGMFCQNNGFGIQSGRNTSLDISFGSACYNTGQGINVSDGVCTLNATGIAINNNGNYGIQTTTASILTGYVGGAMGTNANGDIYACNNDRINASGVTTLVTPSPAINTTGNLNAYICH